MKCTSCKRETPDPGVGLCLHCRNQARIARSGQPQPQRRMRNIELPSVSLVMIATRDHTANELALRRCCEHVRYGGIVVFTNERDRYAALMRQWERHALCLAVEPRTHAEWCVWRLTQLPLMRSSFREHILFVESDAAVVNPGAWNPRFLQYDYIGARWPDGVVGNGGFALMSQKLLASIADLKLPPTTSACYPCDYTIARHRHNETMRHRRTLEDMGCRYADAELADEFANETGPYLGAFGVHSQRMLHSVLPPEAL